LIMKTPSMFPSSLGSKSMSAPIPVSGMSNKTMLIIGVVVLIVLSLLGGGIYVLYNRNNSDTHNSEIPVPGAVQQEEDDHPSNKWAIYGSIGLCVCLVLGVGIAVMLSRSGKALPAAQSSQHGFIGSASTGFSGYTHFPGASTTHSSSSPLNIDSLLMGSSSSSSSPLSSSVQGSSTKVPQPKADVYKFDQAPWDKPQHMLNTNLFR
jgi:hypothetical protein